MKLVILIYLIALVGCSAGGDSSSSGTLDNSSSSGTLDNSSSSGTLDNSSSSGTLDNSSSSGTVTTVTLRAYELDDTSSPITNSEKKAGTFTEINDATITSRGWTMTDTGATYSVEVGKSCYSWSRTTAVAHTVNGVSYPAGHNHFNAADNTSYANGVYNWTEYGPEHSQSEIDATCSAGKEGVVKTANSDNYTADVNIYLKISTVDTK